MWLYAQLCFTVWLLFLIIRAASRRFMRFPYATRERLAIGASLGLVGSLTLVCVVLVVAS